MKEVVQFLALVLTALALVPSGAHLFALPNKIDLAQDQYFVVQNIYRGWALFGIVLCGALIANLVLAILLRGQGRRGSGQHQNRAANHEPNDHARAEQVPDP